MHPSGSWMRDFHASIISLALFLGKGLEMRGVHFRAARLSLSGQKACHVFCLFLEERFGDAGCAFWCRTEGSGWMDLLERFRYGHAFKHGQLPL